MDCIEKDILPYFSKLSPMEDPVIAQIEKYSIEHDLQNDGILFGRLLHILCMGVNAKRVLDIYAGTGYASYWACKAVGPEGQVVIIEYDKSLIEKSKDFLTYAGFLERLEFVEGEVQNSLLDIQGSFDVIILHGRTTRDKENYIQILNYTLSRLKKGGIFITTPVFPSSVSFGSDGVFKDKPILDDAYIHQFNQKIFRDPRFSTSVLPFSNGISVSLRIA